MAVKTRPSRPVAPALPAFEALDRTHRDILRCLDDMQRLVEHVDREGLDAVARDLAREICTFFAGSAQLHHEAEEKIVFPPLLASGDAELVQNVRRLQQDHGWLEEDWLELSPQLQSIADGYAGYDIEMLRRAVPVFNELYHEHIGLEESLVYPEARRREQAAALAAEARRSDRE